YRHFVPDGVMGSHSTISKMPETDAIYEAIESAFRKLRQEADRRGWPEIVVCPMDEVAPSSAEFGARVHAAVRRGGFRTFATKNPAAADSAIYRSHDAIDIWCGQPYSIPYEQAISDPRYEYWSYPNHNVGERKEPNDMGRGGRMTYGFGYWRSGYTGLIPWNWRWVARGPSPRDPFDYLESPLHSGCGTRMDEQQNVIPNVTWACLREGYDDARYLYTLQQAVFDRRDTSDPAVRALVQEGQNLIQELWDAIPNHTRYLAANSWTDEQMIAARWRIAQLTEALLKHPATQRDEAPSVLADTTRPRVIAEDPFDAAQAADALATHALETPRRWRSVAGEAKLSLIEEAGVTMHRLDIRVDHETDGGGEAGKYPVGWPRIQHPFRAGEVDLNEFDFFTFQVRIDSDRDDVAAAATPFFVNFAGQDGGKFDHSLDLGDLQREWIPFRISLQEIRENIHGGAEALRRLAHIQLGLAEAHYKHGAFLRFDFREIRLVRLTSPVLDRVLFPDTILLTSPFLTVEATYLGAAAAKEKSCRFRARILDEADRVVSRADIPLEQANEFRLGTGNLAPGAHRLEVAIVDRDGNTLTERRMPLLAIPGWIQ
ncbi:MAG: hypothetical protein U1E27_01475, partial [Kiritimatiellia bacterium]|nr:hypothetical protein [Kiritimatiellia bacterium]